MRPTPLIAAALSVAVLLAACGKSPEDAALSAATGADVERDGDKVTIKTEEGQLDINAEAGQELPASFPKDVFLPSGYSVVSSMDMGGKAVILQLAAPGKASDANAAAGKAMPGMGWEQKMSMQQAGTYVLMFENSDRVAQYSFTDDADNANTQVSVSVSKKE
jgi:hypothetical protein